jgi:Fe-S-cluster-containing dehydrogenase component/formate-dependent nitrite reductase membrane component NrfD
VVSITNYGFVIDNRKCIGCHACTVACKAEHDDPIGVNKTWVKYIEKGEFPNTNRNFSVMRCNHCNDSPCTDVCPVTALWEREDGIVDFDSERCIGCKACMQGCPYDALYIDPETSTASKCNYCSHRVDAGREPACVVVCPEDAIIAGDMENPDTEISETISRQEVQARKPEKGTEPKLFYVDGDEGSTTPGTTGREEHYMWSDAPSDMELEGANQQDFDIQKAAESLANSNVTFHGNSESSSADTRADGGEFASASNPAAGGPSGDGCACGSSCGCNGSAEVKSDGGYDTAAKSSKKSREQSRTTKAYELLHEEAKRVYDIGETHYKSWGWEVYSYTWTKSIGAGMFFVPALLMLAGVIEPSGTVMGISSLVALAFIGITTFLLVIDLQQPQRFHWVLLRPNWNSWLVKGGYILTFYGGFLTLAVGAWLFGFGEILTNPIVLLVGSALAVAAAVYTAFLFSQSKGRDLWQSPAMPLHLFSQAAMAGASVTALAGWVLPSFEGLVGPAAVTLAASLVLHAILVASEIFTPHQTEDAEEAAARITRGEFRSVFWGGGIVIGILLPLVALAISGSAAVVAAAGVLTLAGLFAFEYCWIIAPQTISLA